MKTTEEYKKLLWEKYLLSKDEEMYDRYIHSIAVSKKALELIDCFNLNVDRYKAEVAGILHDYAKFEKKDTFYMIIENYSLDKKYSKMNPKVFHAFLGPYVIEKELGFYDKEIFDAIKYHTTGSMNMDILSEVIFLADYTDETRIDDYFKEARIMSYVDFYQAIAIKIKQRLDDLPQLLTDEATMMYNKYIKLSGKITNKL